MAMSAMKAIGIPSQTVKPVLKKLLSAYDNNWELIEDENYRVLADTIFDSQDSKEEAVERKSDETDRIEEEKIGARTTKVTDHPSTKHLLRREQDSTLPSPVAESSMKRPKLDDPLSSQVHNWQKRPVAKSVSYGSCFREPKVEPGAENSPNNVPNHRQSVALIKSKSKPSSGDSQEFQVPITLTRSVVQSPTRKEALVHPLSKEGASLENDLTGKAETTCKTGNGLELISVPEASPTNIEIASSASGEVKLSLNCTSALHRADFHIPSLDAVLKLVEDKCLKSYKIVQPTFTIMRLMQEFCQCFLELGNDCNTDRHETHVNSLVVGWQCQFSCDGIKLLHDVDDISKGEESVKISVVNEVSSERYPPSFYYIPQNTIYQNAYVNFSLARIGDEDCCSDCSGDCLSSSIPCACARETGGEFAYTPDGLIKEEFLDKYISMNDNPHENRLFFCNECPLEKAKNEVWPEPCKGHLVRKFVKECWSKCGCNKQCGNRVVQRGIRCNLQVFLTAQGKGWGLRTIEELPKGTFVCEYVGEILTNTELHDRNTRTTGNDKHTYPVLLDADWGSEGVLKDEEALCLDATFYGNVARFINHRCCDANLIEIPVEVETPDHHYYHIAFFTTRNVAAFEELTWDYGIDFDDLNHPIKAFRCRCGSKRCRDHHKHSRRRRCSLVLE